MNKLFCFQMPQTESNKLFSGLEARTLANPWRYYEMSELAEVLTLGGLDKGQSDF